MADQDNDHPLVGQVLGDRYRIEALLGEGGMGAVFRARHLSLDRAVAVKVLKPSLSGDEQVAKRFDREALAVSKLDHPNCVQVIDFGTTAKGMKYLVMQYLEGKELRELTGFSLPVEQAVDFAVQVLRALEHAHKRGLVHRDLKPENIFLVRDDEGKSVVKLVDFGIVKLLEGAGQEKLTRMGMAFGTPTYMSPEQAAGGTVDERTDVYAVGVLLYEMLTGAPPFEADEPGILLRMHILAEPPPLPETIPDAVRAVVDKLLAKEPEDRYSSAREARDALAGSLEGGAGAMAVADSGVRPPDVTTDPVSAPSTAAERLAEAPTDSVALEDTRAEPMGTGTPEPMVPVRSGGTVVAGSSTGQGVMPAIAPSATAGGHAAVAGAGVAVAAGASMSHGAASVGGASVSHGAAPVAGASMSHGSMSQHGAAGMGATPYDPLSVSNANLPQTSMTSGVHGPTSGVYGAASISAAHGRRRKRSTMVGLFVALLMLTWLAIGLVWWSGQDDRGRPAGAPAAGVYRFADEDGSPPAPDAVEEAAESTASTPEEPVATEPEPAAPKGKKGKGKKGKGKKGKKGDG